MPCRIPHDSAHKRVPETSKDTHQKHKETTSNMNMCERQKITVSDSEQHIVI